MTPTISSLLSRVRAASGPDRELERDICIALGLKWTKVDEHNFSWYKVTPHWACFTQSIDAAVALVERVLPGCHRWYTLSLVIDNGTATFCIANRERGPDIEPFYVTEGHEASAPLAILAALLSALEQKESAG